jgi:hypothetical protein
MTISSLWPALEEAGDWEPKPRIKRVDAIFAKLPAVPELRELYVRADGGSLGGVDVFTLHELEDVNFLQGYRDAFPGAVFFASDGGGWFFFIDTNDAVGCGAGAIIMMDRSAASRRFCTFVTASLGELLSALLDGERPWKGRETLGVAEAD